MSLTYSQIEHPGYLFPLQSMSHNYDGGRHGQDRSSRQYRLPPPHSSIPIGLVDDQQTPSYQRTDVSHSKNDFPAQRENLPSVRQLLSDPNTSYLPSFPPTPHHGRSLQNSPSIHSRPLSSHYNPPRNSETGFSDYTSFSPSSDRDNEHYRSAQATRLPPISQVGLEASHTHPSQRSRSHLVSDGDSPRSQSFSRDPTTSPGHSDQSLSHYFSSPTQEGSQSGSRGPAVPNQVVDERYLPGKGVCYIFADNSYCPKLIDGQPVNPNWGLTKAGKARKRLAQACIPCREKKVKCQPNLPKCDQCQKSGRECRFESA